MLLLFGAAENHLLLHVITCNWFHEPVLTTNIFCGWTICDRHKNVCHIRDIHADGRHAERSVNWIIFIFFFRRSGSSGTAHQDRLVVVNRVLKDQRTQTLRYLSIRFDWQRTTLIKFRSNIETKSKSPLGCAVCNRILCSSRLTQWISL